MNMEKNTEDYQIENMLENWQKKSLDNQALLAAQSRVWSKIESKLSNSNLVSKNILNPIMSDNQSTELKSLVKNTTPTKSWFLQPLGISVLSVSLLIVIVGGATTFYVLKSPNQTKPQTIANTIKSTPDSLDSNSQYAKLDLSLDEIRSKATVKLNTLTNGVSLDEIQASSAKSPKMISKVAAGGFGSGGDATLTNVPTPEILVKEKGIADNIVYYTENLTTESNGGYLYTYLSNNSNFDLTKPIKSQSWSSANYSKYVLSQDGKTISYNTYSPEFSVEYRGGKYAVKEFFDQKIYLSGISQDSSNANTEINFLRSILSDTTLKDGGKQEIKGKTYKVLESDPSKQGYDSSYAGDIFTIKYYIDQEKLSVYKTENFKNKILVSSTTQTGYQELKEPKLDDIFGVNDLNKIEIKSIKGQFYSDESQNLEKVMSKADIFYPSNLNEIDLKNNFTAYDSSIYLESESNKLKNTIAFDPGLDQAYLESLLNQPIITYALNNLSVNVFKTKVADEQFLLVKEKAKKTIKIDGKDIEVSYKVVTYEYGPSQGGGVEAAVKAPAPESFYRLEFTAPNGLFYQFVEYKYDTAAGLYTLSENINLVKLNTCLATKINDYQQRKQQSYPDLNYDASLEDISKNNRILPGDLSKKYKLELSGISKSRKLGSLSTCDQFLFSDYDLQNCLIEKYNGYRLDFYENTSLEKLNLGIKESSEYPGSLTFVVLDAKLEDIEMAKYVEQIKQNNLQTNPSFSSINYQKNQLVTRYKIDGNLVKPLSFFAKGDKTIIVSESNLKENEILELVNNASVDKDTTTLSNQLKKAKTPQLVDIPQLMNK